MHSIKTRKNILHRLMLFICPPLQDNTKIRERNLVLKKLLGFVVGFFVGQFYCVCFLGAIPFPNNFKNILYFSISVILGLGIATCVQLRCISMLTVPMYCGKPGRGVLKVVLLSYVVAGPITNMGMNAKEVVRVFACTTELSYNLSIGKHSLIHPPLRAALLNMKEDVVRVKETLNSFREVATPIENEVESSSEILRNRIEMDQIDQIIGKKRRHELIEINYRRVPIHCICMQPGPFVSQWSLVEFVILSPRVSLFATLLATSLLGEEYECLKMAKGLLMNDSDVTLQQKISRVKQISYEQSARETGELVLHAFEEKSIMMRTIITILNVCLAFLLHRMICAARQYHDSYLTTIDHDNIYITNYFNSLDTRRARNNQLALLPLKKMERNKYVDLSTLNYKSAEKQKLITQVLKLSLEVITATTFVMLDRLFFEALDVVRRHAEFDVNKNSTHDLDIEVVGTGLVSNLLRSVVQELKAAASQQAVSNQLCVPQPHLISPLFYVKIYGGYLWILLLLFAHPYTSRWKRLICAHFYPRREKQRILHLYNDILKKRMKMEHTLRKKAVQTIRAHYLCADNLLALRIRFPQVLGWLRVLPAARMNCLICNETEPKDRDSQWERGWRTCSSRSCPFVYCADCWREGGARCLACDPALAHQSDVDSLSD